MLDPKTNHHAPAGTGTLGMWLFLAALTMLFGATMTGYAIIRITGAQSPRLRTISLPESLWLSTALMLLGSWTIHRAVASVRRERQRSLRRNLLASCLLAAAFVIIQTPSLYALFIQHQHLATAGMRLYGLIFFLILIHALHVLGGIIGLAVTTLNAHRKRYDHENYAGVKHAAMYWHFLDAVWLVMFLSMFLLG